MNRRQLILLFNGAMILPRILHAQQRAMPVIGFLSSRSPGESAANVAGFRQGLREAGCVEGQDVAIEYSWAEGHYDRLPSLAADLAARKVDVIVAAGGIPSAQAARNATPTIPIVFTAVADPVGLGLVASLARPGGNLTGTSLMVTEMTPKRLELLSELVPQAAVITLLVNPNIADAEPTIWEAQEAAHAKHVQLKVLKARSETEIDEAFSALDQLHADRLLQASDPFFLSRRAQLVALAARHRVPAIYDQNEYAEAGGLIS
jgi:putative ABC transport system substrate-binding protein